MKMGKTYEMVGSTQEEPPEPPPPIPPQPIPIPAAVAQLSGSNQSLDQSVEAGPDGTHLLPGQAKKGRRRSRHGSGPTSNHPNSAGQLNPASINHHSSAAGRFGANLKAISLNTASLPRIGTKWKTGKGIYGSATSEEREELYDDDGPQPQSQELLESAAYFNQPSSIMYAGSPVVPQIVDEPPPTPRSHFASPLRSSSEPMYDQLISSVDSPRKRLGSRRFSEASYSSMDSGAAWQEEYRHRPSWCDARTALRQVKKPIMCRITKCENPNGYCQAVGPSLVFCNHSSSPCSRSEGGRLENELKFLENVQEGTYDDPEKTKREITATGTSSTMSAGFQIVIQTPRKEDVSILNREELMLHADALTNVSKMTIEMYKQNWSLSDFCFKPEAPKIEENSLTAEFNRMLAKVIPCLFITPLDCFWDGSKPLGPFPPLDLGSVKQFIPSLAKPGGIHWGNVNPNQVLREIDEFFPMADVQSIMDRAGFGNGYVNKPCIDPLEEGCPDTAANSVDICRLTEAFLEWNNDSESGVRPKPVDFGKILSHGCDGIASNLLHWPEALIIGGLELNKKKEIIKAEAYQSVMLVVTPQDLASRFNKGLLHKPNSEDLDFDAAKAAEVINAWQRNFTEMLYNHPNNSDEPSNAVDRQFHPLASTSVADMLKEFSKFKFSVIFVGYLLMLIYTGLCLGSWRERGVESCAGLGIAGVLLVTFASVAGLGCATVLGIEFNAATTQIVPFLTLGLGVDDMFLLVHSYQETVRGVCHNEIGHLLKETGLSVLLTSINNIMAFSVGGFLPVPALRSFCFQTAILLVFNMLCITTLFPAVIAIDLKRRKAKRVDILCCLSWKDKVIPSDSTVQAKDTNAYDINSKNSNVMGSNVSIRSSSQSLQAKKCGKMGSFRTAIGNIGLEYFVSDVYAPFLSRRPVKAGAILFFVCLFGVGCYGCSQINLGLELTDVIPIGTAPYAFLKARETYFSFWPIFVVLQGSVNYPEKQSLIKHYAHEIKESEYVVSNGGALGDLYWLQVMRNWTDGLQLEYNMALEKGSLNLTRNPPYSYGDIRVSQKARLAYKLICMADNVQDCSRNKKDGLLENVTVRDSVTGKHREETVIRKDLFYNVLTAWYNKDRMIYYVTQAELYPAPSTWDTNEEIDQKVPPAKPPMYSQIPFFINGLTNTEETVKAIRGIREICDKYNDKGLQNFPKGIPFTFWEQYLHLVNNLLFCIGLITATVFTVITMLLMSPWTAGVIVFVLINMVIELGGLMGLFGLKLNAVSAVCLITAVGIGVEFTVHISLSFLTNMGSKNERMAATLEHMFVPVLHGGISTLLGIIMLAFSEFQFIILYFFLILATLIGLGILNGLVFLPVLLSLIGPRSEVESVDESGTVPPPSPRTVKRQMSNESGIHHVGRSGTEMANLPPPSNGNQHMGGARRNPGSRPVSGVNPRLHDSLSTIAEEEHSPSNNTPLPGHYLPLQNHAHHRSHQNS